MFTKNDPRINRKGRPKACKCFADALGRLSKLTRPKLEQWYAKNQLTSPLHEVLAAELLMSGTSEAGRERILNRLIGRPRQSVELSGSAQAPVAMRIEVVDARKPQ